MRPAAPRSLLLTAVIVGSFAVSGCEQGEQDGSAELGEVQAAQVASGVPDASSAALVTSDDAARFHAATQAREGMCPQLCKKSAEAGCPIDAETCEKKCLELEDTLVCPEENAALIRCSLERPAAEFECTAHGFATLRPGKCPAEAAAFQRCVRTAVKLGQRVR